MRPPLFTTVPSLPMFVVETGESRLTSQSEKPEPSHIQLSSDVRAGEVESEAQRRHHTKVQQIYMCYWHTCIPVCVKKFLPVPPENLYNCHICNQTYHTYIYIYIYIYMY